MSGPGPGDRSFAYMRGFYAGVRVAPGGIDDASMKHPTLGEDYRAGFEQGRKAEREAAHVAAGRTGYVPRTVRTMEKGEAKR